MENLNYVFENYLRTPTNYALLITGKWGVGKTYYYKHTLEPLIKNTGIIRDNRKKYKSIHVSLFGISSLEELQTQIFISIYPLFYKKAAKLSIGLGKVILRGIFSVTGAGDINDYIADVKPKNGELINFDEIVLCFDDLERRNNNLDLTELIGFINSIVENNGAKAIIIANDDKIKEPAYKDLKEKVVGITVEFIPDIRKNLQDIIKDRYSNEFGSYATFLQDKKELILEFAHQIEDNLRILIFCLDALQIIYSEIKINLIDIDNKKNSLVVSKIDEIMRFAMAISIEYKKNEISYTQKNDLDKSGKIDISLMKMNIQNQQKNKPEPIKKSYRFEFIERYYKATNDYIFYNSIYSYITGADKFNIKELEEEVKMAYQGKDGVLQPQYLLLKELDYSNCFKLNEVEYKTKTREMLKYAMNGEYDLGSCLTVFHYATRFENVLNLDITKLTASLKNGLNKSKHKAQFRPELDFYLNISGANEHLDEIKEIRQLALQINEEIDIQSKKKEAMAILETMKNDWNEFKAIIYGRRNVSFYIPFFTYISPYKAYLILNRMDNEKLRDFINVIEERYKMIPPSIFKVELAFLEKLSNYLKSNSSKRKKKIIKNFLFDKIVLSINTAVSNLGKV